MKKYKALVVFVFTFFLVNGYTLAQTVTPELLVNLRYFASNNSYQYLTVQTKIKADNKIRPVQDVVIQLYMDSISADNLVGKVRTNEKGDAKAAIPFTLQSEWMKGSHHKFIAVTEATRKADETITELEIKKARISIDTLNEDGTRSVTAKVETQENGEWVPVKDVELKLGVRRHGGILKINESESVSTDSLGNAVGEFQLNSLPADLAGNKLVLVAQVEDNDQLGNLVIEKTVPWGVNILHENNFDKRSLWATRDKAPVWLLLMAYSIMAGVWGVLIYLIVQLVMIMRIGKRSGKETKETVSAPREYVA